LNTTQIQKRKKYLNINIEILVLKKIPLQLRKYIVPENMQR